MIYSKIDAFLKQAIENFDLIPQERKVLLEQIAAYVQEGMDKNAQVGLLYACIHNSRRSQLGQVWGKVAASYFGHYTIQTYSGGSESKALSPNVVDVLNEVGFKITRDRVSNNPLYSISYDDDQDKITCFSKKYNDITNPKKMFVAILTCAATDPDCPDIMEADLKIITTYEDKVKSESSHAAISKEIATECLYLFSKIRK
ncbi:MAG TPA: hypothetical protein VK750_09880 [Cytophagaceae bacterium]|jgi:arsenate reductase|nr:hypothetical protein [Cytophagaceae bacterium]